MGQTLPEPLAAVNITNRTKQHQVPPDTMHRGGPAWLLQVLSQDAQPEPGHREIAGQPAVGAFWETTARTPPKCQHHERHRKARELIQIKGCQKA